MPDPLHVAHVVYSLNVGGLERNVVNQIREGQKLGQRVSILCTEDPGTLAPLAESLGARILALGKRPGVRLDFITHVRSALRHLRPHVVHTHHVGLLFYTAPAAFSLRTPLLVHTEHGKVNYRNWRLRWLGRIGGSFVQRYYCLNRDMADWVAAHAIASPRKLRVIHNGIRTEDYASPEGSAEVRRALGIAPTSPVVGTVARLHEIKRLDVLIRAFARVQNHLRDAHLLLVGEGPLRSELQALANQLGLADRVHLVGFHARPQPYLHAMNCFALSSRSEGTPQGVLEACVAGIPVIASRVGGLPELLEHRRTGLLFPVGSEADLAAGILELLTVPEFARQLAEAARAEVSQRFDVARMAREYHADYVTLLGRTGPHALSRSIA